MYSVYVIVYHVLDIGENKMENYTIENGERSEDIWPKATALITSKYQATTLENHIFCMGLKDVKEEGSDYVATLLASDIKERLGEKDYHAFYTQLKRTSQRMSKFNIFVENEKRDAFRIINLINEVSYSDGVYRIYFNPKFKNYFNQLEKKFTLLSITTMCSLNGAALRLYEILKSQCYESNKSAEFSKPSDGIYRLRYDVDELRFQLGCVDTSADPIAYLFQNSNTDYSELMKKIKEVAEKEKDPLMKKRLSPKWNTWRNFKRVLEEALSQINEKTEIYVEMEYRAVGKIKKIAHLYFTVDTKRNRHLKDELGEKFAVNTGSEVKEENSSKAPSIGLEELLSLIGQVSEKTGREFKLDECKTLLEVASYDVDLVERQYKNMCSKEGIRDKMAWLISAIRENYADPIPGKKKVSAADNYAQGNIDPDELDRRAMEEDD